MIKEFLRDRDNIAVGVQGDQHFNGDTKYKTVYGGALSVMVYCFMVWYTGNNAYNMVMHNGPYILSMGRAIDYKQDDAATTKVYANETTKIHYEVIDNKFNRFEYEEAKKYVTLTYNQITKKVDANGEVQSETKPF